MKYVKKQDNMMHDQEKKQADPQMLQQCNQQTNLQLILICEKNLDKMSKIGEQKGKIEKLKLNTRSKYRRKDEKYKDKSRVMIQTDARRKNVEK